MKLSELRQIISMLDGNLETFVSGHQPIESVSLYEKAVVIEIGKTQDYLQSIGRKGGQAKSKAKAKSSRANGKLGGRPKGKKK